MLREPLASDRTVRTGRAMRPGHRAPRLSAADSV